MRSLDGLRGLAAALVVFGHLVNASVPSLSLVNVDLPTHLNGLENVLAYTPLHVLYAGQDWVIVFFVLSGFVLSLGGKFIAARYYPGRFVRLYVPVWAALGVAAVAHLSVSHGYIVGATHWLNTHDVSLSPVRFAHDFTLIFGAGDGAFSTVLWSLRWEVLFSLLLPLYLFVGKRLGIVWGVGLSLLVILIGGRRSEYLHYLPAFMLGVVLALNRPKGVIRSAGAVGALLLGSLIGLSANWWLPAGNAQSIGQVLTAASSLGLLICAMNAGPFRTALDTRPMQLLGRRSFSLYLVHEPIVVAIAFALGGHAGLGLLAITALPLVVVVTEAFYRMIERPSHRWARWLAHRTSALFSAEATTPRAR